MTVFVVLLVILMWRAVAVMVMARGAVVHPPFRCLGAETVEEETSFYLWLHSESCLFF